MLLLYPRLTPASYWLCVILDFNLLDALDKRTGAWIFFYFSAAQWARLNDLLIITLLPIDIRWLIGYIILLMTLNNWCLLKVLTKHVLFSTDQKKWPFFSFCFCLRFLHYVLILLDLSSLFSLNRTCTPSCIYRISKIAIFERLFLSLCLCFFKLFEARRGRKIIQCLIRQWNCVLDVVSELYTLGLICVTVNHMLLSYQWATEFVTNWICLVCSVFQTSGFL